MPIDEAAPLTGLSVRHWRRRAIAEAAQGSLAFQGPPRSGKGRPTWWVHRCLDSRLARFPARDARDERARASLLERFPAHHVELAYRKNHWLRAWRKACAVGDRISNRSVTDRDLAARIVAEAKQVEGDDFSISVRALQMWQRAYNEGGLEALVPRYCNPQSPNRGTDFQSVNRSPEAIDYFYSLYHTENKLKIAICHEHTVAEAHRRKWSWPASYTATRNWLAAHDDVSLSFLLRYGLDHWCRRFMPYNEIDYSRIAPGEMFQTDHHQCDFWVVERGKQLRPWLTAVQDMRSRMITGWHLGVTPHQDAIIAAYLQAFRDYAIPKVLRIDNGKDFASRLLTGVTKQERDRLRRLYGPDWAKVIRRDENLIECVDPRFLGITAELGIECIYAIPYSPWSKGVTERFFSTFEERCGKTFATYCGNSPETRPEALPAIRQGESVPDLDAARTAIAEYLVEYHRRVHRGDGMAGRTPLEAWHTATRLRKAVESDLLFLMQSRGVYKVGANGVAFTVGGARLTYGADNAALRRYTGREVLITLAPNDLSVCYAFAPDRDNRRFIARLKANERISPRAAIGDLREANAAVGRRRKIMHRARRESPARTRTAVQELRAQRHRHVAELRKTGTDDSCGTGPRGPGPRGPGPRGTGLQPVVPNIVPVHTGFEQVSMPVQTPRGAAGSSEYDRIDIEDLDVSVAPAAAQDPDEYAGVNSDDISLTAFSDDRHDQEDAYAGVDITELDFDDDAE